MEKILVTGNLGYIGMVLTQELLNENYEVIGLDTHFYRSSKFIDSKLNSEITQIFKDIRNIELNDLKGVDHLIHLAALSNDPLGELNPILTDQINYDASLRLAILAKKANISRFLFSSSCSIYGASENRALKETDVMNPLTAYARSKVKLENQLSTLADDSFSPTYLRNGTAYGISPNFRFDLVINNLMGWGYTTKEIKILSDGRSWRPIVHVRDISNAFIAALKAPIENVHNEAFNVGINSENYQVRTMANEINKIMTDCDVKILGEHNPDQRNYNVNFDKIKKKLKYFNPSWSLQKGIKEIYDAFQRVNLTFEMFQDKNYTRIKQLRYLLSSNQITEDLYWIN